MEVFFQAVLWIRVAHRCVCERGLDLSMGVVLAMETVQNLRYPLTWLPGFYSSTLCRCTQ